MNQNKGTPQDLKQAITNAIEERIGVRLDPADQLISTIHSHVKDKLAQDFGTAYLINETSNQPIESLERLWKVIFPEVRK